MIKVRIFLAFTCPRSSYLYVKSVQRFLSTWDFLKKSKFSKEHNVDQTHSAANEREWDKLNTNFKNLEEISWNSIRFRQIDMILSFRGEI